MYEQKILEQKSLINDTSQYILESNREIKIISKGYFSSNEYSYPIGLLNPTPMVYKEKPIKWIITFFFLAAITTVLIAQNIGAPSLFSIMGLCTFICFIKIVENSHNLLIFTNLDTGYQIFSMSASKPDKQKVDSFVDELIIRIKSIRYPENISLEEMSEYHIQHLNFLINENVLSENEYNSARKRINQKLFNKNGLHIVKSV